MRKSFLLLLLLPVITFAQNKSKPVNKTAKQNSAVVNSSSQQPLAPGSYMISGTVKGYTDGTVVDLLNGYNGSPEASTTVANGKFSFKGQSAQPDMKVIIFNKQAPYITLFLDNSHIIIKGSKDSIDKATVSGSKANDQFNLFSNILRPYQHLFQQNAIPDAVLAKKGAQAIETFAVNHTSSHVTPLAILRHYQLSADHDKMEELYNKLQADIKATPISQYIAQQIAESKKNPIGKELPDFKQADTSGKEISLSSFKGKYVLVDFWASWCGPCRQENPNLVLAYERFKDKNFTVFGVSLDKARKPWIDAIHADKLTWPHVSDLQGWQNAVAQQYQIYSIPQNFLLDPAGKVIAKNLRGAALEEKLQSLLK